MTADRALKLAQGALWDRYHEHPGSIFAIESFEAIERLDLMRAALAPSPAEQRHNAD